MRDLFAKIVDCNFDMVTRALAKSTRVASCKPIAVSSSSTNLSLLVKALDSILLVLDKDRGANLKVALVLVGLVKVSRFV